MVRIPFTLRSSNRPTASPRRWVLWFAITLVTLLSLPYVLGYSQSGQGWVFTGFVFGVEDGNSYIAKMLSGARGAWLFRTPYTAVEQRGALAFLPYLLLGRLAAAPAEHLQLTLLYHLYRIAAGILAVLATYDFISLFIEDERLRRVTLIAALAGGGLGWLPVLFGRQELLGSAPLEFYSPESFGFLGLFGLPHLALARALLLWGLVAYTGGGVPGGFLPRVLHSRHVDHTAALWPLRIDRSGVWIGVFWLLLGLAQPLTVAVGWVVMAAHLGATGLATLWQRRRGGSTGTWWAHFWRAAWAVLVSSPMVLYNLIAFRLDPFLSAWTEQNLILSPHPLHYLMAYGFLLPFAFLGALRLLRQQPFRGALPVVWSALQPVLAYAPFNLQRRLPEGVWVALVVLAGKALERSPASGQNQKTLLDRLFWVPLLFTLPSSLFLLAGSALVALNPGTPVFRPVDEVHAFEFLAENARPGEIVLAAYETGNALPAWAPVRVVIGHGPESIDLERLRPQVAAVYDPTLTDEQRLAFLQQNDVHYVFWGPAERNLGAWDPRLEPYLTQLYGSGGYFIFSVAGTQP